MHDEQGRQTKSFGRHSRTVNDGEEHRLVSPVVGPKHEALDQIQQREQVELNKTAQP